MNLLTDESPQVYHPTLATWVGLNEAIFLAQLHFVLVKNDKVGKFADGRKWYRDKPHDFVVKYFPFWDEGIVKRVIDNLRADGLLMARSDLNQDHKDRSLWYTIHYEAIERLTGPVERLVNKSAKRKEARAARKSRDKNSDNYTKVQNVLMNEIPTICTFDPSTNCTSEKVQNVPTPKESSSKTPLPKDSRKERESRTPETQPEKLERIGVVDYLSQNKAFAVKLCEICGNPGPEFVVNGKRRELAEATAQLLEWQATVELLQEFRDKWKFNDDPWMSQVVGQWGRFLTKRQKASANGQHKQKPLPTEKERVYQELLAAARQTGG